MRVKLISAEGEVREHILEKYRDKVVTVAVSEGVVECKSDNFLMRLRIESEEDLKDIFEILADRFDIALVDNFGMNFRKTEVFRLSSVEDLKRVRDFETLRTLIEKVKSENSELCGAIGVFIGFVRKISEDKEVVRLEYEAYDDIFDGKLKEIEEKLMANPGVEGVRIYHKTGTLHPGEDIVYVVVMGRHRKDIWKPLAESMEIIKRELPIWKKEVYKDGEVWVHDMR
jgi:molybdopterin synthase catalytic subunit